MTKEIYSKCRGCDGKGRLKVEVPDKVYLVGHNTHKDKEVLFIHDKSGQFQPTDDKIGEMGRELARWLYCYAPGNFMDALMSEYKLLEE